MLFSRTICIPFNHQLRDRHCPHVARFRRTMHRIESTYGRIREWILRNAAFVLLLSMLRTLFDRTSWVIADVLCAECAPNYARVLELNVLLAKNTCESFELRNICHTLLIYLSSFLGFTTTLPT